MTVTDVIKHVKKRLGLSKLALPVTDEDILENIYDESLRTFSAYFPYNIKYEVGYNDRVPNERNAYYLDIFRYGEDIEIYHIEDLCPINDGGGVYGVHSGIYPTCAYDHLADMQIYDNFSSMIPMPILFTHEMPDKIIFDMDMSMYRNFTITLGIGHPRNFKTIKPGMVDEFYKMCRIDTKILLYPLLKHVDKIDTTSGTIDLKIDDWSNAEEMREDLIKFWKDNYLAARKKKIYNV